MELFFLRVCPHLVNLYALVMSTVSFCSSDLQVVLTSQDKLQFDNWDAGKKAASY